MTDRRWPDAQLYVSGSPREWFNSRVWLRVVSGDRYQWEARLAGVDGTARNLDLVMADMDPGYRPGGGGTVRVPDPKTAVVGGPVGRVAWPCPSGSSHVERGGARW